jgi:hypothetical protein
VADLTSKLRSAQAQSEVGQLVGTWWDLLEPDISLKVLGLQTWTLACKTPACSKPTLGMSLHLQSLLLLLVVSSACHKPLHQGCSVFSPGGGQG